jgi:hypothetical protein
MRRSSSFKKTDVTRATRAVLDAGLEVGRVELNLRDGVITVVPGKPGESHHTTELIADGAATPSALDRELADFKARHDQD